MLNVSQQTIARWENTSSELKMSVLRDLAIALHTSSGALSSGSNDTQPFVSIPSKRYAQKHADQESLDYFWGHAGVKLRNSRKSLWYPITAKEYERVYRFVQRSTKSAWAGFETINKRFVAFPISNIYQLTLLDDAADHDEDDWELAPDAYSGWPDDLYDCLDDFDHLPEEKLKEQYSDKLIKTARDAWASLKDFGYNEIYEFLDYTTLYRIDGSKFKCLPDELLLHDLYVEVDDEYFECLPPNVMILNEIEFGRTLVISKSQIELIDIPMKAVNAGFDKTMKELDREPSEE